LRISRFTGCKVLGFCSSVVEASDLLVCGATLLGDHPGDAAPLSRIMETAHRLPAVLSYCYCMVTEYELVWFISLDLGKDTALHHSNVIPGLKVRKHLHGFPASIPLFL
jgi:hypothetical protein